MPKPFGTDANALAKRAAKLMTTRSSLWCRHPNAA
jgi:hypothetical protein